MRRTCSQEKAGREFGMSHKEGKNPSKVPSRAKSQIQPELWSINDSSVFVLLEVRAELLCFHTGLSLEVGALDGRAGGGDKTPGCIGNRQGISRVLDARSGMPMAARAADGGRV